MLRWISVLAVLLYGALLVAAWCARKPTPPPVTVSVPPAPPVTLTVYYEKDPLPEELCKSWATQHRAAVVQRPLTFTNGAWPADGDLYIVSPRWLASLQQQLPLRAPADGQLARVVNPAFTSQPFDADNQRTVPWRWTPWVFYRQVGMILTGYLSCEYFDDMDLYQAISNKARNFSANKCVANDPYPAAIDTKTFASEAERWRAFLANEIQFAILPASYMEKNFTDPRLAGVMMDIPYGEMRGTIIHLDLLATPADADPDRQRLADALAQHLLAPEQQQCLVTVSGYFPVATKLGHEYDFAPVPLPKEHWFNRSEFLINRPPPAVEFASLHTDFLFDGGSVLLDFDNSDNTRVYIVVKNRDPQLGDADYQRFYIAKQRDLNDRKEIIAGSEDETAILAKAEKFLTSDRSSGEAKNVLRKFIQLMKNRKLQWHDAGGGAWPSIRRVDASHPLAREVIVSGSDARVR